jgi:hypothetical protein
MSVTKTKFKTAKKVFTRLGLDDNSLKLFLGTKCN